MGPDRVDNVAAPKVSGRRSIVLAAANRLDRVITVLCRFTLLVTGIALTVVMTASVGARYVLAKGGIDAAQELPERLFPWFIVAGVALAAQAGGHMAVEWLLGKLDSTGRRLLLLFGNLIVIVAYAVLFEQALEVAEIAKLERSPVLGLSGATAIGRLRGMRAAFARCAVLSGADRAERARARFSIEYKEM